MDNKIARITFFFSHGSKVYKSRNYIRKERYAFISFQTRIILFYVSELLVLIELL